MSLGKTWGLALFFKIVLILKMLLSNKQSKVIPASNGVLGQNPYLHKEAKSVVTYFSLRSSTMMAIWLLSLLLMIIGYQKRWLNVSMGFTKELSKIVKMVIDFYDSELR